MQVVSGRRATDAVNNNTSVNLYVLAIVLLSIITMGAVVAVVVLRPDQDNTAIIAAILGFTGPTILSMMALVQRENHRTLNSRLDQLITLNKNQAYTAGTLKGAALPVNPSDAEKLLEIVSNPPPVITKPPQEPKK